MELDDLPDPSDLWWSWVLLAAHHRATGDGTCGFDPDRGVLHLETADGSWVRMQRVLGTRATLWGRSSQAPAAPPDARHGAPDWALTDATLRRRPSFLAWFVHGEWDHSSPCDDEGAVHLLRPVLTVDPASVRAIRSGTPDPQTLDLWTEGPHSEEAAELVRRATTATPTTSLGAVRSRLRDQIHEQMRATPERDRMLIQRPPALVRWSRVNASLFPFEYAVMVMRDRMAPSPGNTPLPEAAERSLSNVLHALHREEAGTESGAWLFARVTYDGTMVGFDRAFDSWPEWYGLGHPEDGPGLEDLAWEMAQRSVRWRPVWASLLPDEDRPG